MGWGRVRSRDLLKAANAELGGVRAGLEGERARAAEAEAEGARLRGELEAARAASFGTFQELQRAREAAEARAAEAEARVGPLEDRVAGLGREASESRADAAALRAQMQVTGELNDSLRERVEELARRVEESRDRLRAEELRAEELEEVTAAQSAKIHDLEHRQSKLEVQESTQLLREACELLEEVCHERAALAEELERGLCVLQADASILRAALRTQFEFLQQDREALAGDVAQVRGLSTRSPSQRVSSPGALELARGRQYRPGSPLLLRRGSPQGVSPLSRALQPPGAALSAASVSAAAAAAETEAVAATSEEAVSVGKEWGLSNARVSDLLQELGCSPAPASALRDLESLGDLQLHRIVQRDSDLLAHAETFELGQMDAESTMLEVEQRVKSMLGTGSAGRGDGYQPHERIQTRGASSVNLDARLNNLGRLREAKSRLDHLHREIDTQRRESHNRRQAQVRQALTPGLAAAGSPADTPDLAAVVALA